MRTAHRPVDEVSDRHNRPEQGESRPLTDANPSVTRKLKNLGQVQFAFGVALKTAAALESQAIFEPIV